MRGSCDERRHPLKQMMVFQTSFYLKLINQRLDIMDYAKRFDIELCEVYNLVKLYLMEVPVNLLTEFAFGLALNLTPPCNHIESASQRHHKLDQMIVNFRRAGKNELFQFEQNGQKCVMMNPSEGIVFENLLYKVENAEVAGFRSLSLWLPESHFIDNESCSKNQPSSSTDSPFTPYLCMIEILKTKYGNFEPRSKDKLFTKVSFGGTKSYITNLSKNALNDRNKHLFKITVKNAEIDKLLNDGFRMFIHTAFANGDIMNAKEFMNRSRPWNCVETHVFPRSENEDDAISSEGQIESSGLLNVPCNYVGIGECELCLCCHTKSEGCYHQNMIDAYFAFLLFDHYFKNRGRYSVEPQILKCYTLMAFIIWLCFKENPNGIVSIWTFTEKMNKFLCLTIEAPNLIPHVANYDIALDLRDIGSRLTFNPFSDFEWDTLYYEYGYFRNCDWRIVSQEPAINPLDVLTRFRTEYDEYKQKFQNPKELELKKLHKEFSVFYGSCIRSVTPKFDKTFSKYFKEQTLTKFGCDPCKKVFVDKTLNIYKEEVDVDIEEKEINRSNGSFATTRINCNDKKCITNCLKFNSRTYNKRFFN